MASTFQIRLSAPVRGVALVAPPYPAAAPQPAAPAPPPPPAQATPPPPSLDDLWQSEVGRHLQDDRRRVEDLRDRLLADVAGLRQECQQAEQRRLAEWRQAAVELALTIATKLLHERMVAGEFAVEGLVRDMVGHLGGEPPVTVRLNPDDLALLRQRLGGQPLFPGGPSEPLLAADPALGRGDCRVEAQGQTWLADLTDQLAAIRDQLLRSLGHAGP